MDDIETTESPLITIWEAPRATIRRIVDTDPRHLVTLLFFLGGLRSGIDVALERAATTDVPLALVALLCLVTGLVAIPTAYLSAWYVRWVATWFGGVASRAEAAAAIAWATVPSLAGTAVLFVARLALFGTEIFRSDQPAAAAASPLLTTTLRLAPIVFMLWSGTVAIVCFAEVNRFSVTRAVLAHATAVLLAVAVVGLPIAVAIVVLS